MGWRPRDVYECTVWEFWASWEGWVRANSSEPEHNPLTRSELDELLKGYDPNGG